MATLEEELARATPQRDSYLSIGMFDGVHMGHRSLLERLEQEASSAGSVSGVVTFRNHPVPVLHPEASIPTLTTVGERTRLLQELGIDMVVPVTFTLEVSRVTAAEFVSMLQRHLRMRGLVVGPDFALGHGRGGTPDFLRSLGADMGFTVTVADVLAHEGARVSSTAIRSALAHGDLATVSGYLGRSYALQGSVVHGEGRGGSVLGYPTANLSVEGGTALPSDGIYATWAYVEGACHAAATSIGLRPTFGGHERTVEAFLLDFDGDLYGKPMRLEFVQRLRDEVAFEGVEALKQQMGADVEETRRILGGEA
jgi:riboflavin kinase/FMN adenylyltransferase